jgi:hypothetical protein
MKSSYIFNVIVLCLLPDRWFWNSSSESEFCVIRKVCFSFVRLFKKQDMQFNAMAIDTTGSRHLSSRKLAELQ